MACIRRLGVNWMLAMAAGGGGFVLDSEPGPFVGIHLLSVLTLFGLGQTCMPAHGRQQMHYKGARHDDRFGVAFGLPCRQTGFWGTHGQ